MSVKLLFAMHGVIYAVFAVALFFIPDVLWPLYGVSVNDQYARFLSQHNSIFLGGIAIISLLFSRTENDDRSTRLLVVGLLWTNLLGVAITLYAGLIGIFVGFGWSDPAFFTFMAGLCVWCLSKTRS